MPKVFTERLERSKNIEDCYVSGLKVPPKKEGVIQMSIVPTLLPERDDEGFLLRPETWTKDIALLLAQGEAQAGLTEDHWKVIDYLRNYYVEFKSVPPVRKLCKRTGLKFSYICELFPSGLTKGACKIAGIPRRTIKPSFHYP